MAQNIPPQKSVLNANAIINASAGASPAKERPPRPPSNRLSRRTSTDAPSGGQRSPRRNTSTFDAKSQGGRFNTPGPSCKSSAGQLRLAHSVLSSCQRNIGCSAFRACQGGGAAAAPLSSRNSRRGCREQGTVQHLCIPRVSAATHPAPNAHCSHHISNHGQLS